MSGRAHSLFLGGAVLTVGLERRKAILHMLPSISYGVAICQGGDLYTALRHHPETMRWDRLGRKVALDIALGMNYLHNRKAPMMHRDLKVPHPSGLSVICFGCWASHLRLAAAFSRQIRLCRRAQMSSSRKREWPRLQMLGWCAPKSKTL